MMISLIGRLKSKRAGKPLLNQRGVGLIEILLSVVVLGSGIVWVYQPMLAAMSTMNYVDTRSEASRLLSGLMWELRKEVDINGWQGVSAAPDVLFGNRLTYRCRKKAILVAKDPDLYRVTFKMEWTVGGQPKKMTRTVYVTEQRKLPKE